MKKYKLFILLNIILILFSSCSTVKDGFKSQRKNSSDEFMVEKKSPLVIPPEFDELPVPKTINIKSNNKKNEIKKLITKTKKNNIKPSNSENITENFEKILIEKIKEN